MGENFYGWKRHAIDNIFIERMWGTVQYENIYLQAIPMD
jgi:hypothetical protein